MLPTTESCNTQACNSSDCRAIPRNSPECKARGCDQDEDGYCCGKGESRDNGGEDGFMLCIEPPANALPETSNCDRLETSSSCSRPCGTGWMKKEYTQGPGGRCTADELKTEYVKCNTSSCPYNCSGKTEYTCKRDKCNWSLEYTTPRCVQFPYTNVNLPPMPTVP